MKEESGFVGKSIYPEQPYKVSAEELITDLKLMLDELLKGNVTADSGVSIEFTFSNGQKFLFNVKEV